jgi:hypothetical protein
MPEDFIVGTVDDDQFVPGLELTFEPTWRPTDPRLPEGLRTRPGTWGWVRPGDVGVVMTAIDEIWLASIRADLPPADYRRRESWAMAEDPRSFTARVSAIRMGSPLQVILDLPAPLYVSTFAAFAYGLGHVLGIPYRAAAAFHNARKSYFEARHESAKAKDAWLEYKAEQVQSETQFRLRSVEVVVPPHADVSTPIEPPANPEGDST